MKQKRRSGLLITAGGALLILGFLVVTGVFRAAKPIPPEKIVTAERATSPARWSPAAKSSRCPRSSSSPRPTASSRRCWWTWATRSRRGRSWPSWTRRTSQAQVREAKATLEAEEANLQAAIAAEAKARIEAANPALEFTRRDYERAQGLFKEKIASQQQLDDAERAYQICRNHQQLLDATVECAAAQIQQARARVAAAKAALDRAEESLGYATIRAPISGIILLRPTEVGDAVSSILNMGSAASLIMILGDLSSVYIKGEVDEADIGKTALNQCVRTKVESYPNESFDGVVKRIAPDGLGARTT